jgi:hypothetical protein
VASKHGAGLIGIDGVLQLTVRKEETAWIAFTTAEERQAVYDRPNRLEIGRPTHIACLWDGREIRYYLDGVLVDNLAVAKIRNLANDGFRGSKFAVGAFHGFGPNPYGFAHGTVDEVRISKTARYVANFDPPRRHVPDADTVALYHLDEGSGEVAVDASGNRKDGQITGAKWVKSGGAAKD